MIQLNRTSFWKRVIVLGSFVTIISTGALKAQQFKAGVLAGVCTSQVSGDQLAGFNKAGLSIGGFVKTELSEKFDVSMEILYIQKGSKKNTDPQNNDYTFYRLRLNYFEIPLLLRWKYSKRFVFEGGPAIGALLSSSEEDEYGPLVNRLAFKKNEIGGLIGMDVTVVNNLTFVARMESSLLPIREHQSGETYRLNRGQYNGELVFMLKYTFAGKKPE